MSPDDAQRPGETEVEWRARIRALYGPGSDDLTPREEREYERERAQRGARKVGRA